MARAGTIGTYAVTHMVVKDVQTKLSLKLKEKKLVGHKLQRQRWRGHIRDASQVR